MSVMMGLAILAVVLFVVLMIVVISRRDDMCYGNGCGGCNDVCDDEEVVTHTTTTTTTTVDNGAPAGAYVYNGYTVQGFLTRGFENDAPFVIDPVDRAKIFLNPTDDMYEDAAGALWEVR